VNLFAELKELFWLPRDTSQMSKLLEDASYSTIFKGVGINASMFKKPYSGPQDSPLSSQRLLD